MPKLNKRLVWLWLAILSVNLVFLALPRSSYEAVVVHHSASEVSDYRGIRKAHNARGWFEIAYHLVLSNGSTDIPRGHLFPTRRYDLGIWSVATRSPRFNLRALHLCVVGNFEQAPVSESMKPAIGSVLAEVLQRHQIPPENIFLHRECSATACPGKHVDRESLVQWLALAESAPVSMRAQHLEALDRFRLSNSLYNSTWLLLNLVLFLAFYRGYQGTSDIETFQSSKHFA